MRGSPARRGNCPKGQLGSAAENKMIIGARRAPRAARSGRHQVGDPGAVDRTLTREAQPILLGSFRTFLKGQHRDHAMWA